MNITNNPHWSIKRVISNRKIQQTISSAHFSFNPTTPEKAINRKQ
jgi:hypothetical protein